VLAEIDVAEIQAPLLALLRLLLATVAASVIGVTLLALLVVRSR
jgi:hypothetical protein